MTAPPWASAILPFASESEVSFTPAELSAAIASAFVPSSSAASHADVTNVTAAAQRVTRQKALRVVEEREPSVKR
jgi:hypothetical protein